MESIKLSDIKIETITDISVSRLEHILSEFRRLGNTYMWKPPLHAGSRRAMEKQNSNKWLFGVNGKPVVAEIEMSVSCKNVYTTRRITYNGKSVESYVTFLKRCIEVLKHNIEDSLVYKQLCNICATTPYTQDALRRMMAEYPRIRIVVDDKE